MSFQEIERPSPCKVLLALEEMPYRQLNDTDRLDARMAAREVMDTAQQLLGKHTMVVLPPVQREGKHVIPIVASPHATYQHTTVIIDLFEVPEGTTDPFDGVRSASYGIFANGMVINRPNLWLFYHVINEEGKPSLVIDRLDDKTGAENYEVGTSELTELSTILYDGLYTGFEE